jgi:plastocyanin
MLGVKLGRAAMGLQGRSVVWLLVTLFALPATLAAGPPPATLAPHSGDTEHEVLVKIRARQFEPDRVMLQAGQRTLLIFHNQDVELHAFVPVGLFEGLHLNIGGNGAPEFSPEGFKRVIIPSEGRAEFRFVPTRPGVYPFFCDMPGHEMKATIVVQ